ncbi:MAG: hypothetical protein WCP69_05500 [Bacteroidota bacterium]
MRKILIFFLLLLMTSAHAQVIKNHLDLFLGAQFGGPLPSKSIDSSSGNPLLSPQIGARLNIQIFQKSKLSFGISISQKGASYQQHLKRDTLIDIGLGVVPSFYTANVVGEMKLLYIDVPVDFCYAISQKQSIALGVASSILISGYDRGTVSVSAGYGGFADFKEPFNNYSSIRGIDFGGRFFYKFQFSKLFFTSIEVYRSFKGLYKNNENNLYHTHMSILFGFSF